MHLSSDDVGRERIYKNEDTQSNHETLTRKYIEIYKQLNNENKQEIEKSTLDRCENN